MEHDQALLLPLPCRSGLTALRISFLIENEILSVVFTDMREEVREILGSRSRTAFLDARRIISRFI